MESAKPEMYTLQSELFQEMNEEHGIGDTPDVNSKSLYISINRSTYFERTSK